MEIHSYFFAKCFLVKNNRGEGLGNLSLGILSHEFPAQTWQLLGAEAAR